MRIIFSKILRTLAWQWPGRYSPPLLCPSRVPGWLPGFHPEILGEHNLIWKLNFACQTAKARGYATAVVGAPKIPKPQNPILKKKKIYNYLLKIINCCYNSSILGIFADFDWRFGIVDVNFFLWEFDEALPGFLSSFMIDQWGAHFDRSELYLPSRRLFRLILSA